MRLTWRATFHADEVSGQFLALKTVQGLLDATSGRRGATARRPIALDVSAAHCKNRHGNRVGEALRRLIGRVGARRRPRFVSSWMRTQLGRRGSAGRAPPRLLHQTGPHPGLAFDLRGAKGPPATTRPTPPSVQIRICATLIQRRSAPQCGLRRVCRPLAGR